MWAKKSYIRKTLATARKFAEKLSDRDVKQWFDKTDAFAKANDRKEALWCLCVASALLFQKELKKKKERQDIISQIHHQFLAYGRPE